MAQLAEPASMRVATEGTRLSVSGLRAGTGLTGTANTGRVARQVCQRTRKTLGTSGALEAAYENATRASIALSSATMAVLVKATRRLFVRRVRVVVTPRALAHAGEPRATSSVGRSSPYVSYGVDEEEPTIAALGGLGDV